MRSPMTWAAWLFCGLWLATIAAAFVWWYRLVRHPAAVPPEGGAS